MTQINHRQLNGVSISLYSVNNPVLFLDEQRASTPQERASRFSPTQTKPRGRKVGISKYVKAISYTNMATKEFLVCFALSCPSRLVSL
jgi:hypothetical protein